MAGDLTISRIQQMKGQGLNNNQIIQALQRDGYSSSQIFAALNQAASQPPGSDPPSQSLYSRHSSTHTMEQPMGMALGGGSSEEEMIEAIIDEKWNDLLQDINKIIAWKDRTTQQIAALEQQLRDLKEQFDKLHTAIIGKVGEYDEHILQVGAEIKAMEKVFSKVLPAFTENVAELSRISTNFKRQDKK